MIRSAVQNARSLEKLGNCKCVDGGEEATATTVTMNPPWNPNVGERGEKKEPKNMTLLGKNLKNSVIIPKTQKIGCGKIA